jgi:hypothetical protein
MPLLLRVAHLDDVPPGTSRVFKVRGEKVRLAHVGERVMAFVAESAPMADAVGPADLEWARRNGAREHRVVVRGAHVYVAIDADRQSAPAAIQENDRPPAVATPAVAT